MSERQIKRIERLGELYIKLSHRWSRVANSNGLFSDEANSISERIDRGISLKLADFSDVF